jgi:transcriptional regulator with XRE-family HTH domain
LTPEEAFGMVLADSRKAKGLSQEKLAAVSGLDRTFISLLERGQRQPSLTSILTLSKALGIPAEKLILAVTKKLPK